MASGESAAGGSLNIEAEYYNKYIKDRADYFLQRQRFGRFLELANERALNEQDVLYHLLRADREMGYGVLDLMKRMVWYLSCPLDSRIRMYGNVSALNECQVCHAELPRVWTLEKYFFVLSEAKRRLMPQDMTEFFEWLMDNYYTL